MPADTLKICRYCREEIRFAAKVCPNCQQWYSAFSLRNPFFCVWVFSICGLLIIAILTFSLNKMMNPGIDFLPYRDHIRITESQLIKLDSTGKNQSGIYIVGLLTNQTDFAWKQIQFDVRFFDKAGEMIDSRTCDFSYTILPHDDSSFRIKLEPAHALAAYETYRISIGAARDARSRLN